MPDMLSNSQPDLTSWAVSLAPTFPAAVPWDDSLRFVGLLHKLGASGVEEVATILPEVVKRRQGDVPVIAASCPKVRTMIHREFPHIKKYVRDSLPPTVLHAKSLRQRLGSRVLQILPCTCKVPLQKKQGGADMAITFADFLSRVNTEQSPPSVLPDRMDSMPNIFRLCVLNPGITGLQNCRQFLRGFPETPVKQQSWELTGCRGGCLAGAGMPQGFTMEKRRQKIASYTSGLQQMQSISTSSHVEEA